MESLPNGICSYTSYSKNRKTSNFYKIKNNKIIEHYIYNYIVSSTINKLECGICYELKSDWISIHNCNHNLCYDCYNKLVDTNFSNYKFVDFNNYCNYIFNNSSLKCPYCRGPFSFMDITNYTKSNLGIKTNEIINLAKTKKNKKI